MKPLKSILFAALILLMFVTTSCIDEDTGNERTFEQEMAELDLMIQKIIENGTDVDTTEAGVYYIVNELGEGPFPSESDTLSITYVGYLPDGTIFDTSENYAEDGIIEFVYPEQYIIEGFNDGLSVMNKGSEIEMIIPSNLAYGEYGSGFYIGPYQTILFTVNMVDLKPISE